MKKKLTMCLSIALIVVMAICGTLAYLTSEDGDVNVMTLGGVEIDQIEKERTEQSDENTSADNVQDFTQNKPLYPAVYDEITWADGGYQEWPTGGSNQLFNDDIANVQDKAVFIENTGKSDAYVRTWFAFEAGDMTVDEIDNGLIHWNRNTDHWHWTDFSDDMTAEIDGVKYYLRVATYTGNAGEDKEVHVNGVLPMEETTRPSLLQIFFGKEVTNEDIEAFGDTYEILAFSQAIQTEGFEDPIVALNTGFGEAIAANHPWADTNEETH